MSELPPCPVCGRRYSKSACSLKCGTERLSPRWWRDYEAECVAWVFDYARRASTTNVMLVSILVARFGGENAKPLCAILPSDFFER